MPYPTVYSKKQSPIDSVHTTINSSPLETIRDHLWLLKARRERKDGGEDGASKVRGEQIKGCGGKRTEGRAKEWEQTVQEERVKGRAEMDRDNNDHR